jgi:hypothetical protein
MLPELFLAKARPFWCDLWARDGFGLRRVNYRHGTGTGYDAVPQKGTTSNRVVILPSLYRSWAFDSEKARHYHYWCVWCNGGLCEVGVVRRRLWV